MVLYPCTQGTDWTLLLLVPLVVEFESAAQDVAVRRLSGTHDIRDDDRE